jgi:hypothetical protein
MNWSAEHRLEVWLEGNPDCPRRSLAFAPQVLLWSAIVAKTSHRPFAHQKAPVDSNLRASFNRCDWYGTTVARRRDRAALNFIFQPDLNLTHHQAS